MNRCVRDHSITTWTRRGGGGLVKSPQWVTWQRVDGMYVKCPYLFTRGGWGAQSWVKFGPRSCWMTPNSQHCFCTWLPSVSNPCYHINLHLEDMIPIHRLYLPILQRFNTEWKLNFTIFYLNIQTTSRAQIQFINALYMTQRFSEKKRKKESKIKTRNSNSNDDRKS